MPHTLIIHVAREDEFDDITRLWMASWESTGLGSPQDASFEDLRARIAREVEQGWHLYVAHLKDRLAGMLAIRPADCHLDQIFIAPEFQHQGIGKRLLAFAREQMPDEIWLRTSTGNERAWRWYEREGFVRERVEHQPGWSLPRAYYRWKSAMQRPAVPAPPAVSGEFVTETFEYDGGRQVTVYVPSNPPEAIIYAGDGQRISKWGRLLEKTHVPSTMIVGVHSLTDETLRLHEYSPGFEPMRFAAHERFFVEEVCRWTESRFGVALPAEDTAVCGVSAGGELALALGLRHPNVYGAVFCASPGAGYKPPGVMPSPLPRTYLVAGTQEPFFLENARRWADALRNAGADVTMKERAGSHGGAFWQDEFPLMVAWAFGR